jgi:hypothetical protein
MQKDDQVQNKHEGNQGVADWVNGLPSLPSGDREPQQGNQDPEPIRKANVQADAVFIGWQETPSKEFFALYNITAAKHPLCNSTVTEKTLLRERLQVPNRPIPPGLLKKFDDGK